jgi:hypothetical protein
MGAPSRWIRQSIVGIARPRIAYFKPESQNRLDPTRVGQIPYLNYRGLPISPNARLSYITKLVLALYAEGVGANADLC